jgi:hypothetical protein
MRPVSRLPLPGCQRSDRVATGDINGDGKDDMVIANNGDGTITILLSR